MAVRHVLVEEAQQAVWQVLADPSRYADWVPGTSRTRPEAGRWPAAGASLRYTVKAGPVRFCDRTVVRVCEPPRRLELEAYAGRLGSARIAIELVPWGDDTVVVVDEHPLRGPGGGLHMAPVDTLLQLRHRQMLARLAEVVRRATATAPPLAAEPAAEGAP